jgi:FSR family fosmidomycin resistance protein-like MFS transporter
MNSFTSLVIIVGLGSIASAIYHPLGSAMAVALSNGSKGKNLSIFMTIGGFASSLSPIVAIPIAQNYGLDKLSFLMIPGLFAALFMYFTKIHTVNISNNKSQKSIKKIHYKGKSLWLAFLVSISTTRNIITKVLISFGIQILMLKNLSLDASGNVLFIYLLFTSIGTILGGYLIANIGCKRVFIISNIILLLSLLSIIFLSGKLIIIPYIFSALSFSSSHTPNVLMAQELIPQKTNFATGLILGLSGGLAGLLLIPFGRIADSSGLINAMMFLLIPLLIVNVFTMVLPEMRKKC